MAIFQITVETVLSEIIEDSMLIQNAALQVGLRGEELEDLQGKIAAQVSAGRFEPKIKEVVVKAAEFIHVKLEMQTGMGFDDELVEAIKTL